MFNTATPVFAESDRTLLGRDRARVDSNRDLNAAIDILPPLMLFCATLYTHVFVVIVIVVVVVRSL